MSADSSPSQDPPAEPRLKALGLRGFVIELFLPAVLSATILLTAASFLPWWNLRGRLGIGVFGVLLVVLSFVLSVWVDSRTLARRQSVGKAQLLNRANAPSRLVKFVLGGIVIPLAAFVAANLVKLPDRRTPMSVAAQLTLRKPVETRAEQLGSAVLRAREVAAKVAGITALQASSSTGALDQLFRILAEDPTVLRGGAETQALAKALASYGKLATPRLLERFAAVSHGVSASSPRGRDAFERYFGADFEALRSEVGVRSLDPAMKTEELSRLQAAEAQLRQSLDEVESAPLAARGGDGLASLVMQTLLEMSLGEATHLLAFARQVAADAGCSDGVRGHALLLVARLGGKGDLDLLYEQLSNPSPLLQTRALQAIAALNARLASGGSNG
jgi:hypothetical protein